LKIGCKLCLATATSTAASAASAASAAYSICRLRRLQASEQELTMIKVAQAMDTIAIHACPNCLDGGFGFGLTASTGWEVW
jgi:hypothetical protein